MHRITRKNRENGKLNFIKKKTGRVLRRPHLNLLLALVVLDLLVPLCVSVLQGRGTSAETAWYRTY